AVALVEQLEGCLVAAARSVKKLFVCHPLRARPSAARPPSKPLALEMLLPAAGGKIRAEGGKK
ncbi:MAG TPA: hypothetical protein VF754_08180, partial [Pyrinomonadaceae bacterium]